MNYKRTLALLVTMGILLLGSGQVTGQQDEPQSPQGTYGSAFTYQGQLKDATGPVNGQCDLRFMLWDAASGGSQVGWTWLVEGVEIVDGLFTARLDFGSVHDGNARWLEVAVRCPAGSGDYVTLSPRQELTGAPAALSLALPFYAEANIAGPLVSFHNSGDGEAAVLSSQQGFALWVEAAGLDGLLVATAGQDGVHVVNAGGQGLAVDSASSNGVFVNSAGANGVDVESAGSDGVFVRSAAIHGVAVGSAGWDGLYVGSAGAIGVHVGSAGITGVDVGSAGGDGVYVGSAGGTGVRVANAGNPSTAVYSDQNNGFEIAGAEGYGLYVGRADLDGVFVNSAGGTGVYVNSTAFSGVHVDSTGYDGVVVHEAGNPSTATYSPQNNGFEVAGAEGDGLYVGRADNCGIRIKSAEWVGVYVEAAGEDGVAVHTTGRNGLYVFSAGNDALYVNHADGDGVFVHAAGNPSEFQLDYSSNGFEVAGAQGYGLYVGRADLDGVYVNSTAWHGLNVAGAGVDGLYVSSAGSDGVDVAGSAYAGNFHGNIYVSGDCIGCSTAVFGLNAGDRSLEPGQIVAIQGIEVATLDNAPALWRVVPAGEGAAAVGVVRGKAEVDETPEGTTLREGDTGRRLVPRSGVAQPGDYLTIVIYGPMQVRVSAADGPVEPGTRLAVGKMGEARPLKTVVVEGLTLAESAPTIGIALTAPDEDGLVWVLVNPQ